MMNFNRDRGPRGPVEMHRATCDGCGNECQVPFKPTNGKPVFCSSCFENNKSSDSRGFTGRNNDRSSNFEDRPMFAAVCDDCGNSCKVPFNPRGDKPIYCSNCFEGKKEGGSRGSGQGFFANNQQFEELNNKLDKILQLLVPSPTPKVIKKKAAADQQPPP